MSNEEGHRSLEIKVGAFVTVAILLGLGVVFLLGQKRHVFEPRVTLHAAFTDVSGLREGAPVWLSGVNVGAVTRVAVGRPGEKRVMVDLEISRDMLSRVRADSTATIGSQGLLGDKIVEIAMGSSGAPMLSEGAQIETTSPADLNRVVEQASNILQNVQKVAEDAVEVSHQLAEPRTVADFRRGMSAARVLLEQAVRGPGLAHALFYDGRTAHSVQRIADEVDRIAGRVDHGIARVDQLLDSTDADGKNVLNNLSRAARSIGAVAGDLERSHTVANLDRAAGDAAAIIGHVRAGQGTLGALVADPTVYEQLVTVLGGVQRSRILRALVRYAIAKDDGKSAAKVIEQHDEAKLAAPKSRNEAKR